MHLRREVTPSSSFSWLWWTACALSAGLAVAATIGIILSQLPYPSRTQRPTKLLESDAQFERNASKIVPASALCACDAPEATEILSTLSRLSSEKFPRNLPLHDENLPTIPTFEYGELVGYTVIALSNQSVFFAIGIRKGDVLLSWASLPGLQVNNRELAIQILRRGAPIQIRMSLARFTPDTI